MVSCIGGMRSVHACRAPPAPLSKFRGPAQDSSSVNANMNAQRRDVDPTAAPVHAPCHEAERSMW